MDAMFHSDFTCFWQALLQNRLQNQMLFNQTGMIMFCKPSKLIFFWLTEASSELTFHQSLRTDHFQNNQACVSIGVFFIGQGLLEWRRVF